MAAKQPTSAARATQSLALLQGQYRQRLSDCTNALLDNFVALMQLSQVRGGCYFEARCGGRKVLTSHSAVSVFSRAIFSHSSSPPHVSMPTSN